LADKTTYEPSIFELVEWAQLHHPEFLDAINYIHGRYDALHALWCLKGRPELDWEDATAGRY